MSSTTVRSDIPQPSDIVLQLSLQVVLNRHPHELLRERIDLRCREVSDMALLVDRELGEDLLRDLRADAVEFFERRLQVVRQSCGRRSGAPARATLTSRCSAKFMPIMKTILAVFARVYAGAAEVRGAGS